MLRPWLAIAVVACGHGETAPVTSHAGTVTDVAGKVTITHDGRAHDARTKDVVEADDIVATGADGHVTIVLAKNDVPWDLGPGRSTKVRDSVAWDLPQRDPNAKPTDENSETAGRPAERTAADTESSRTKETTVARNDTPPPPVAPAKTEVAKSDPPKPAEKAAPPMHVAPPPDNQPTKTDSGVGDKGGKDDGILAQRAVTPQQHDLNMLIAIKGALAACFTGGKPTKLVVRIDGSHAVVRIAPIGVTVDDAAKACLAKAVGVITFQSANVSLTVDL